MQLFSIRLPGRRVRWRAVRAGGAGFWCALALAAGWALVGGGLIAAARGAVAGEPRILGIEHRGVELVLRVGVPAGVTRVVLEGCRREDLRAWIPKATARVTPADSEVVFTLPAEARMEMFRVRVDASDPLPASWYTGQTDVPWEPSEDPMILRRDVEDGAGPVDAGAGGAEEEPRAVVESDIWVMRGDTLYFFNQLRGLQVIDVSDPDAPVMRGTFRLPGAGEQMYLAGETHAVLLAHDPCRQWGTEAESAVWVLDTSAAVPVAVARLPLEGRIVESRWVGSALYVATETWEPMNDGTGAWQSGTRVAAFDFAVPAAPVARGELWFPGSGNVVTATDRFFFVAVTDYSRAWPWKSDLEVLDITAPDGAMTSLARLPLPGRVPDKFKIDVFDDVLRVVTEAVESPDSWRFVTVLETYRLSDPRAASPQPVVRLDRLELARGERLFATRFDGVRGYVVTFLRVDPLWVLDLSDPADLRVSGELEIPGWSTYLRPMGDRLLTLGVDDARGWRVAVQLFDVSNPAKPELLAKVPLGEDSSWSEANHDEKAFGVFPTAGLLMVPVSEWTASGSEQGVQLLDLGRDSVVKRGLLKSDAVVPRRATLHRERILTVSGRELVSADLADRDQPRVTSTIELAYPVERVLRVGEHLLEFQGAGVRVRHLASETLSGVVALGELPLLGALEKGGRLHVLQGRAAEVIWDHDAGTDLWTGRTNTGLWVASVWDASALPALRKLGEATRGTDRTWMGDAEGFWLRDGLLLWASTASMGYRWAAGVGALDALPPVGSAAVGGRLWRPWGGSVARSLVAVEVSETGGPVIRSDVSVGEGGVAVGQVFHAGGMVYTSRETTESVVIGTNTVIETAWFPGEPRLETNRMAGADGELATNVVVRNEGQWRAVTNRYPVLSWWSRHELDVLDYGADPADPQIRPGVPLPGSLEGMARDGSLLFTTGWRTGLTNGTRVAWLDASAYDGVAVHRIDSVPMADEGKSESYAVASRGGVAYVARGGWGTETEQRLEAWGVDDAGKWALRARAGMDMVPGELKWFGDALLARNGGSLALFGVGEGEGMEVLPVAPLPGCYGGDLGRGDGDLGRGVWLPLGDYGAIRVGP